jgi:hypothetical protein
MVYNLLVISTIPLYNKGKQYMMIIGGIGMFNFLFGSKKAMEKAEKKLARLRKTLNF